MVFRDFVFIAKEPRQLFVWDEETGQHTTTVVNALVCAIAVKQAASRSGSPNKSQRMKEPPQEPLVAGGRDHQPRIVVFLA
jgi:hypothetical protein